MPHWEVQGGRYFITIHLAGAIPAAGRERIRAIAEQLGSVSDAQTPQWLSIQRRIFAEMERWLDRASQNASLKHPHIAAVVADAIEHRHERGDWQVFESVIMPTHLHLFCEIGGGMKAVLEDFKRWTGHQAAQFLGREGERFWQREWFDHWSRSDEEDERIVAYIRNNPVKAGLVKSADQWPYTFGART